MAAIQTNSGLAQTDQTRYHFDIYAILEAPQELYFGHETQVNVNMVETVRIATDDEAIEKCYISPTKRRGVERRSLIWAPLPSSGILLGDKRGCGIPHTCAQPDCPICAVYGGLITSNTEVDVLGKKENRKAIQPIEPSEKQRAMHPSAIHRDDSSITPMPFKRQYNEPALLYPVYNHCMSVTEQEFQAVAYAFLDSLARLGAGNPKGVHIVEQSLLNVQQPLLVVDCYLAPLGKRPVISPTITQIETAVADFASAATWVHGQNIATTTSTTKRHERTVFTRWLGNDALVKLQEYATGFVTTVLV
jgi:hypothetical protein